MQPDGDPGLPASYVLRRVIRVEDSRREQRSGGLKEAAVRMWRRYLSRRQRLRFGEKLLDVETAGLVDEHPGVFMPLDAEAALM